MTDQKDAIAVAIKWLAAAVICHALATSPLVTLANEDLEAGKQAMARGELIEAKTRLEAAAEELPNSVGPHPIDKRAMPCNESMTIQSIFISFSYCIFVLQISSNIVGIHLEW